ncbi:MAG: transposase family protein [Gammaproteobacteria bacterium]|nr:transposase family protein [Gammaproteobacteria bacterium]
MWIEAPKKSGSLFYNYQGTFSVVLMAVVDSNYSFKVIRVGDHGSAGDAGIFSNSAFGKRLMSKFVSYILDKGRERILAKLAHFLQILLHNPFRSLPLPAPMPLPNSNEISPFVFVGDSSVARGGQGGQLPPPPLGPAN